jgi:hypothetical protein
MNPPTSSSAKNNKKTVESFGAITENPSGPAMVRVPSDLSPLPPAGWRKGIDSDAPAGLSPPPIKSVACVEDGGFYIEDSWDGEPDCIWYNEVSRNAQKGFGDSDESELARQRSDDIIWNS